MNQLLLTPTDTLFFRDGRPMEGALSGHGAAWPLPTVTNAALHAALHAAQRGGLIAPDKAHRHDHMRGVDRAKKDIRAFGSLVTAGPFPVDAAGVWYFPRPLDLTGASLTPTLVPRPLAHASSLSAPLTHHLRSTEAPSKDSPAKAWLSADDFETYLAGAPRGTTPKQAVNDDEIYHAEAQIGIKIDAATGTTGQGDAAGMIYSSHSLRLHDGWRLGLLAHTHEKQAGSAQDRRDLIGQDLYRDGRGHLILGGQQRVCTVLRDTSPRLPLPAGLTRADAFRADTDGRFIVKWVLLTPAIYPAITAGISKRGTPRHAHPGGWLPTWIDPQTGAVLLQSVDRDQRLERRRHNYNGRGYESTPDVPGRLIAARIDKPVPVTGWSVGDDEIDRQPGAKSTHLAVPAGSVYYFACDTADDAARLAAALNWHGADDARSPIRNRRSTLLGEKGFGLGVCGTLHA
jgi:CRISPR-associated protein (Cas_Cmr3).